ncbi:LysR family transcriptional regulator [Piscinibacter sp.]|jgi:DNA-binding transcriptional LysR family regulator|uniref:LysR family transcriptional regulator n=1 Tax=Piscinibacter sp. TaxID=1903157 RepID=UPI001B7B02FF|nr:LysR family transcriptional regulator [Piscinibacter sp.]MBK7532119.1 LysR family transcriptional regulator [Piscinibacter sp.]MBP6544523.1 LysR family transcriptional regulator [Piscinibacter sp.]
MSTPDPNRFDWALVRSFLAVLDAGSLMGAARRLNAQQPTLSRHVAELEAQLGTPLFERTGRGVTPTAAALAIADAARQMEAGALTLSRSLTTARNAETGTVRITTSEVAATWLLPPLLAQLQAQEPGIAIELVASNQLTNLLRREADIAVRMVRPAQASLVARKLGEIPIIAAAHRDYLARFGTPKRPEDLAGHRLIGFDRDDGILKGFAQMGMPLTREHFALRTDAQIAYGQLVAAGAGIGFVAQYNLRHWPGVLALLPQLAIPPLPCWLAVHREIRASRLVRRVYDFLAEAIPPALA